MRKSRCYESGDNVISFPHLPSSWEHGVRYFIRWVFHRLSHTFFVTFLELKQETVLCKLSQSYHIFLNFHETYIFRIKKEHISEIVCV